MYRSTQISSDLQLYFGVLRLFRTRHIIHFNSNSATVQFLSVRLADALQSQRGPSSTCAFIYWAVGRGVSLRKKKGKLHSLSEPNQYPIIVFQRGNGSEERKRNHLVYYGKQRSMNTSLLLLLLLCWEVKLGWNRWKWETVGFKKSMEEPKQNRER